MDEPEVVTITKDEYTALVDTALWLSALEDSGVDNWQWYDEARKLYRQWKRENSI